MVLGLGPTTCTWSPEMFDIQNNRTFFDWTQYYAVYSIVALALSGTLTNAHGYLAQRVDLYHSSNSQLSSFTQHIQSSILALCYISLSYTTQKCMNRTYQTVLDIQELLDVLRWDVKHRHIGTGMWYRACQLTLSEVAMSISEGTWKSKSNNGVHCIILCCLCNQKMFDYFEYQTFLGFKYM